MPWSTEFNKSVDSDIRKAEAVIKQIDDKIYNYGSISNYGKVGRYYARYSYPELKCGSRELLSAFKFALTHYWHRPSNMFNLFQTIPVAVLIGSGYELDIALEELGKAVEGDDYRDDVGTSFDRSLPVSYEEHLTAWPEIKKLQDYSLKARFAFVRMMQYFSLRVGLAEYERVNPRNINYINQGLRELISGGLVRAKPNPEELLMFLTVKKLKHFATENGVEVYGRKKELIHTIVEKICEANIAKFFSENGISDRQLCPNIANTRSLKSYVWAETRRIELYANWIAKVKCLKEPPPKHEPLPQSVLDSLPQFEDDPLAPFPFEPGNIDPIKINEYAASNPTEIRLVRNIWDAECDAILRKLFDKYKWFTARFICDAIEEYLPAPVLQRFIDDCAANRTANWNWVLTYAAEARILELGLEIPKPKLLKCAGCSIKFREWSIGWILRKRVGKKVLFCNSCYQDACFPERRSEAILKDPQEMLRRLLNLAEALETIPTALYMGNPDLAGLSDDKHIEVVKALIRTPSYSDYIDQFETWFQALNEAGVLQDGMQKMSRGYRCIANDGHTCYSIPEKTIDDWLSAKKINHEKEPQYPFDLELNPTGLRPDWQVGNTLIEYAGMMDVREYAGKMHTKQELAAKYEIPLIILEPEDILNLDERLGILV